VWICYAELIMCGMYAVYYLHVQYHWPLLAAMAAAVVIAQFWGVIPAPVRDPAGAQRRADQPAAGDREACCFSLQAAADARLRHRVQEPRRHAALHPARRDVVLRGAAGRVLRRARRMVGMFLFLSRTYLGTAIRAISQDAPSCC